MQHHSTLQIFLFGKLLIPRIFSLAVVHVKKARNFFWGNLNPPNAFPQKDMMVSISKKLVIRLNLKYPASWSPTLLVFPINFSVIEKAEK